MKRKPYAKLIELIEGSIENGYSPKPVNNETGRWVLGLGALTPKGLNLSEKKSVALDDTKFQNRLLNEGDFLVSRSNTREKVGQASLYIGGLSNCIYPDLMMRFRINKSLATIDYIDHYLRSPIAQNYFASRAAGSNLSMVKITKSILAELLIYNPSLQEQKAIAAILSRWDEAIEKTEQLIALKEKQFKELLTNLLNGKSGNLKYAKRHKISFHEIFIPFKKVNRINRDYEVLSVTKDGIVSQSEYFNKDVASEDKSKYLVVDRGVLVMSGLNFWMGSIDFQNICEIGLVSPAYKTFKIKNDNFDRDYLRFFVRSSYMKRILISSSIQGASIVRRNLDIDVLMNSVIHLPDINEQKSIARILNKSRHEIDLLNQLVKQYLIQKNGLMQKLLTGKWRVNFKEEK